MKFLTLSLTLITTPFIALASPSYRNDCTGDGCVIETTVRSVEGIENEILITSDGTVSDDFVSSNDSPATTEVVDIWPTPKPFLKEPQTGEDDSTTPQTPSITNFNATANQSADGEISVDSEKYLENISIKQSASASYSYYVGKAACECGTKGIRIAPNGTKIVNGVPARIEEYPWTVGLLRKSWLGSVSKTPYCGGTLINNLYIATASHCVDGMSAGSIIVALHEEDFSTSSELGEATIRTSVEKITMHPSYNRRTIDNDIALLKMSKPVELGKVMIPACLPANNKYTFEGEVGTVAGWGATSEGGGVSNALRKVDVPIINNLDCNTKTKYNGKITDNMMCAGYIEEGGKDSCQGDSGGPFIIENGGRRTLVGIVSWGYGCARPQSPGVYTRTGQYPEWILANTPGADWCSG